VQGDVQNPYNLKASAKYNERKPLPVESMMWKNTW
jgi:dCTP deaminase